MGVVWWVYCPKHRESLELDKWWHLSRVGALDLTEEVIPRTSFNVNADGVVRRSQIASSPERLRQYIAKWSPVVAREKARLAGRVWWGRARLERWVGGMERRLAEVDRELRSGEAVFEPLSDDEDLVAVLKSEPLTGS